MKSKLQETIDLLRQKVKSNLDLINTNQEEINTILNATKPSERQERMPEFESKFKVNKELLSLNNDLIKVQITLMNFLDKHKSTEALDNEVITSVPLNSLNEDEIFELTKVGDIEFNDDHPFFDDNDFFDRLLAYFESTEQYEKCQEMIVKRNQIS
ncbi:MAG: hypothetical protein GVY19_05395 [Bacteroidetes bacterium]|jgi:hypothetical protein|nr:hypothetical protein [Bacteroidota bacterium]